MKLNHVILKGLRHFYGMIFVRNSLERPTCENDPDRASQIVSTLLDSGNPGMISRLGSNELNALVNYLGVHSSTHSILKYIRGDALQWWWNKGIVEQMGTNAGFFPLEPMYLDKFCRLMIDDLSLVDILGSWRPEENHFNQQMQNISRIDFELLNPFFARVPWTRALEGKKVLVVHPFSQTIQSQYQRKDLIFPDGLLPDFELKTIQAVQSIVGEKTPYHDWFSALDSMSVAMDSIEYDVALIGCGAYGFPLAAHAKRMGKVGFHIGGGLQLLFGIRGQRWENSSYHPIYNYSNLMNDFWVKPSPNEKPQRSSKIEGACYW